MIDSQYFKNQEHEVFARMEVVLCAGAINSPQILMLSGIGPREQLQRFNVRKHQLYAIIIYKIIQNGN